MPWSQDYRENGTDVVKHTFDWVSAADGSATLPSGLAVSGQIQRIVIDPSGSAAPSTLYDLTLTDEDGVDVLAGQGANLSETTTTSFCPGTPLKDGTTTSTYPTVVDGILTLNITNAGDTKAGKVVVYVR
jgi:hypothetical protein